MKSRSALFVLVLLLLTVSVCAAQSPMGFSPDEFYQNFKEINSAAGGPESTYAQGDEENGAYIVVTDDIVINLLYTKNEVTEIYLLSHITSDNQEKIGTDIGWVGGTIIITLAYESGLNIEDIDFDEYTYLLVDLFGNATSKDYCGYHFEWAYQEVEDYVLGVLWVTKIDDAA